MVRHRLRSHHGGSQGGRTRPQTAQSVDQRLPSVSPPSSQANSPPPSPTRRPFPHNAFQTTHFKFQSRLNKPIIIANITIIFCEEEAQFQALVSTVAEHPKGGLRTTSSLGSGQTSVDEGKAERRGNMHGEGVNPNASQPPGGSSHVALSQWPLLAALVAPILRWFLLMVMERVMWIVMEISGMAFHAL